MKKIILTCLVLGLVGCFRADPEGPAERIGKGIDQVAKGINDLNSDPSYAGDSHTRTSNNTQGKNNENYRSNDYWSESDAYWREHDPAKKFGKEDETERKHNENGERY